MRRTLVLIALALGCLPLGASASPVMMPPELWVMDSDGTDQRVMNDPTYGHGAAISWSPDSAHFVATGLVIVDVATGDTRPLVEGRDPDWSPVSDDIVFSRTTSNETSYDERIYVIGSSGGEPRLLVSTPELDSHPSWSPDGTQIAFVSGGGSGAPGRIHVVNSDGSGLRPVSDQRALYTAPEWSPDGERLVYETFAHGLRVIEVRSGTDEELVPFEHSSDPSWCTNGTLYFWARPAADAATGIYSLSVAGPPAFVTRGSGPDCSSTGKVAFTRGGDIHVTDPGTAGTPNLTDSPDRNDTRARWSPDATKIAFETQENIPPPTPVERQVTLSLRRHLVARGLASRTDVCPGRVLVQRLGADGWRTIARSSTYEGAFRKRVPDRPGFYRAVLRHRYSMWGQWECLRAVSSIVRHRH